MDKVTGLADIVQHEVELYNEGKAVGADTFALGDIERQNYAVIAVPHNFKERPAWVIVMARVIGEYVVIDEDTTDKPLVDALMINGGIARSHIILAYAGESLPVHKYGEKRSISSESDQSSPESSGSDR